MACLDIYHLFLSVQDLRKFANVEKIVYKEEKKSSPIFTL